MANYETYLFDLDGTLIDSIELILASFRHMMTVHRGMVPPEETWIEGLGTPLVMQLRAFATDEAEIAAMLETYREHNLANHDRLVREYPGVREAVLAIGSDTTKFGVVTSKKRPGTLRGLAACGYDGKFEAIVTADDVDRYKPNPDPVLLAVDRLNARAESTVFVGDSPHDMAAGRAAGVATAAVLWGPFPRKSLEPHRPTHWLSRPSDLFKL